MIEDSMPVPNLAANEREGARSVLFTLPGTGIEVSLARIGSRPDRKLTESFMVYFRHKGTHQNLGYIHVDVEKHRADCSISEVVVLVEDEYVRLHRALAFAASVIKSGERWSQECEEMIGSLLGGRTAP